VKAPFLFTLVLWGSTPALAQNAIGSGREVAVTFDDVPGVQRAGCSRRAVEALNQKLIAAIKRHHIPATGLVVESICGGDSKLLADVLRLWRDAGLELGNHSYSHLDINHTPLQRYQADVIRGEATTRMVLAEKGKRIEYFRHPFLHAGKDLATKRAFERFLAQRGYRVAPVTIDNQEWVFAEVYARALRKGDRAAMQRIGAGYLEYMAGVFDFFERLSREVLGYEVKQVLLLHDNPLNADYLDGLVRMMERRGYRFVSLEQALSDPAYQLPDAYAGPQGLSWIHRWSLTKGGPFKTEPREPEWIAKLYQEERGN